MLRYAPPAYRPAVSSPTIGRQASHFSLGQTFDQYFSWPPAVGDGVRLIFHGATAFLGFRVWHKDTGFWKWFGLLLAIGQTVGAICDTMSLVERLIGTHPPESPSTAPTPITQPRTGTFSA